MIEAAAQKSVEPRPRIGKQAGVVQHAPDRDHPTIDMQGVFRILLGLRACEFGRGAEQLAFDRHPGRGIVQQLAGLFPGGVIADQGIGHHEVHGHFETAGPFPFSGLIGPAERGLKPRRLNVLGTARLIIMGRVGRVDLCEFEHDRAGQNRHPGSARRRRPGPRFGRGIERGLRQVLPRLVINPGLEIEPLIGKPRLAVFHDVIGIMMEHSGKDLDRLLGDLLAAGLGRIFVIGDNHAATATLEGLGLIERPGQGLVAIVGTAGGTAAESKARLQRHHAGDLFEVEAQDAWPLGLPQN